MPPDPPSGPKKFFSLSNFGLDPPLAAVSIESPNFKLCGLAFSYRELVGRKLSIW